MTGIGGLDDVTRSALKFAAISANLGVCTSVSFQAHCDYILG